MSDSLSQKHFERLESSGGPGGSGKDFSRDQVRRQKEADKSSTGEPSQRREIQLPLRAEGPSSDESADPLAAISEYTRRQDGIAGRLQKGVEKLRPRRKLKLTMANKFLEHCRPARQVHDRLVPFLDTYQQCQGSLEKADNLSIKELQDLLLSIENFQGKVEKEIRTSDQRYPEAARGDIKTFLDTQLEQMRAAKDTMDELRKKKSFGKRSETIFQGMKQLLQESQLFTEKLGNYGITTLDTLKENTIELHKVALPKGISAIFESGDVLLLTERNAAHRVITEKLKIPGLGEDLMELLKIPLDTPDRLLAQTALALKYTSKYMSGISSIPGYDDIKNRKKALEYVQKKKTEILENPSAVIFLPIEYRRQGNIQEGTLQAAKEYDREHMRALVEKDLDQLKFSKGGEEEWARWQNQSSQILRFYLDHLRPQFLGKEVHSLEVRRLYRPEDGSQAMLKVTMEGGEACFSNSALHGTTFAEGHRSDFFSGDQIEVDYTGCYKYTISKNFWQNKEKEWHLGNRDYQSRYHPMIEDYADNLFHVLINKREKKRISILELGCGDGDLAELMLKKLKEKYPDVHVTYGMADISIPDIETAEERFKRLDCGKWEMRPKSMDIFAYGYNAEKALKDMEMPNKVDIVISCGGPLSPQVGGTFEETIELIPMIADMLDQGGYILATGGSGLDPTRSHYEEKMGMDVVKNTYHMIKNGTIYGLPMQVIQNPYGKKSSLLNTEKKQ